MSSAYLSPEVLDSGCDRRTPLVPSWYTCGALLHHHRLSDGVVYQSSTAHLISVQPSPESAPESRVLAALAFAPKVPESPFCCWMLVPIHKGNGKLASWARAVQRTVNSDSPLLVSSPCSCQIYRLACAPGFTPAARPSPLLFRMNDRRQSASWAV